MRAAFFAPIPVVIGSTDLTSDERLLLAWAGRSDAEIERLIEAPERYQGLEARRLRRRVLELRRARR